MEERSFCPGCGRETRTVARGACADCWGAKPGGEPGIRPPEQRTERLFGSGTSIFEDYPIQAWGLAAVVAIAIVAAILRALLQ